VEKIGVDDPAEVNRQSSQDASSLPPDFVEQLSGKK